MNNEDRSRACWEDALIAFVQSANDIKTAAPHGLNNSIDLNLLRDGIAIAQDVERMSHES